MKRWREQYRGGHSKKEEQYGMREGLVYDWETGKKEWSQVRRGTIATGGSLTERQIRIYETRTGSLTSGYASCRMKFGPESSYSSTVDDVCCGFLFFLKPDAWLNYIKVNKKIICKSEPTPMVISPGSWVHLSNLWTPLLHPDCCHQYCWGETGADQ